MNIKFSLLKWSTRLFWVLVVTLLVFLLAEGAIYLVKDAILGDDEHLISIYSIQAEGSIGTWLSVMVNFLVGVAAYGLFKATSKKFSWQRRCWMVVSLFFVYLSIDDLAMLHEQMGFLFKNQIVPTMAEDGFRLPSYGWQYIYGPFFAGMGFFTYGVSWKFMKSDVNKVLVFAGLTLFAAAVGLDFVEGDEERFMSICQSWNMTVVTGTRWFRLIEEFLEILGSSLIFLGFCRHLHEQLTDGDKKQIHFI